MIKVENLTKTFGQHVAVNSVSLDLQKGETLGLLGPNGAGKTTIMRMMTGYLPPSDGRVLIKEMEMFDQPEEVKKNIGYLPEQPPLYLDMTVNEYLRFAGQIRGMKGKDLQPRIEHVAGLCGISDKLGRLTGNLSKGYRQRVGLAQALVHDPEILILDEPTSGLDPKQIIEIRDLIKELGRERTVILSSHILQEVTSVCEKVAILNTGKLVAFDTIENLSGSLRSGQTIIVNVAQPERVDVDKLGSITHITSVSRSGESSFEIRTEAGHDVRDDVSRYIIENGAGLLELRTESMTLEDIFLKVIAGEEA